MSTVGHPCTIFSVLITAKQTRALVPRYQAEERKRAEEFAKILEQEAAERRARKEEELRLARLRAIQEAEQFAKAASEDLCWDIVTDSDKVPASPSRWLVWPHLPLFSCFH